MTLRLNGSTSGYTEIDAPAVAGSNTLVLPTGNGTNGQFLQGNGSGTLSWSGSLTLGTAQNSTSGTSIDFTGIPSWAKRVTVMFDNVSTTGTSVIIVQIGSSGGIETTSYSGGASNQSPTYTANTVGFLINSSMLAAASNSGHAVLTTISSNKWIFSTAIQSGNTNLAIGTGAKTLSGTLDRVRITTVGGTDTFDAGSINIMYEG